MATVHISSKGQITLPAALRRLAGLELHDPVLVVAEGDHLVVRKAGSILSWQGKFKAKPRAQEQADLLDAVAEHVQGRKP
jgi:AbrB family looped-hinge helix DNA binding protein